MDTIEKRENPNPHEKPYLHAKPAPTPQALSLTYIKILEHKQKPNLHENPYLLPIL